MTRRHLIAVVVAVAVIVVALVPPLWIRATGDEVTLAIRPADPLSLFRGNYVDLAYDVEVATGVDGGEARSVYAVFADDRPAPILRVVDERPSLGEGEFCIRAKSDGRRVWFPNLEQFFLTRERAAELGNLADNVAVLRVTDRCHAVLVDIEPLTPDS